MTAPEANPRLGVILAGGQSRRMGGTEKSLIDLAGKPLAGHVLDRLRPQVGAVVLNANGDAVRFAALGLHVVADRRSGYHGPLAGIEATLATARLFLPQATHVVSVPADTPFIPDDLAARLQEKASGGKIVIAASNDRPHPAVALWPLAALPSLARFLDEGDERSVLAFATAFGCAVAEFPPDRGKDPFFNINTPQDLAAASQQVGR
jgi:molybdopterin-guanine dinucleotide biosynthesis protein A